MTVVVRIPGVLRGDAEGAARYEVELADGATLRELFEEMAGRYPRLERRVRDEQGRLRRYVNVFVDGQECRSLGGLAVGLGPGATVHLLPSVAGGATP